MPPPQRNQVIARRPAGRRLGAGLIALGFLMSGMGGAGVYFLPVVLTVLQARSQVALPSPSPRAQASPQAQQAQQAQVAGGAFTVLLLGSDNDAKFDGQPLTQSMILARIDPGHGSVVMLSIPRDLWVPIPGYGYGRIDQAYEVGGAQGAIATVQSTFGVRIDDYAWIGLQGLVRLIDLLGGVDVIPTNPVLDDLYPNDINTQDPYSLKRLAVMPGPQHMDGTHALEYVRSRHSDIREDFGRSFRQQQVLIALRAKAGKVNPADLPDLVQAFNGELQTSLSPQRIAQLLPMARGIKPAKITQIVLLPPYTYPSTVGDADVLLPDWSAILPLVRVSFPSAA
jgi:LCP family protein required for cell wall assembly